MTAKRTRPAGLTARRQFVALQQSGHKVRGAAFVLLFAASDREDPRVGYTVSSRVGNAVVRNRVRRCLREAVRHHRDQLASAHDYVFIAQASANALGGRAIDEAVVWLLAQAKDKLASRPVSASLSSRSIA